MGNTSPAFNLTLVKVWKYNQQIIPTSFKVKVLRQQINQQRCSNDYI